LPIKSVPAVGQARRWIARITRALVNGNSPGRPGLLPEKRVAADFDGDLRPVTFEIIPGYRSKCGVSSFLARRAVVVARHELRRGYRSAPVTTPVTSSSATYRLVAFERPGESWNSSRSNAGRKTVRQHVPAGWRMVNSEPDDAFSIMRLISCWTRSVVIACRTEEKTKCDAARARRVDRGKSHFPAVGMGGADVIDLSTPSIACAITCASDKSPMTMSARRPRAAGSAETLRTWLGWLRPPPAILGIQQLALIAVRRSSMRIMSLLFAAAHQQMVGTMKRL